MKTQLLSISALFTLAFAYTAACQTGECRMVEMKVGPAVASLAANAPAKKEGTAAPAPSRKSGEKPAERPTPPAHLFM